MMAAGILPTGRNGSLGGLGCSRNKSLGGRKSLGNRFERPKGRESLGMNADKVERAVLATLGFDSDDNDDDGDGSSQEHSSDVGEGESPTGDDYGMMGMEPLMRRKEADSGLRCELKAETLRRKSRGASMGRPFFRPLGGSVSLGGYGGDPLREDQERRMLNGGQTPRIVEGGRG